MSASSCPLGAAVIELRRTVYGKSKSEVQEKLRKVQNDVAGGQLVEPNLMTVKDYLQRWLENTAKLKTRSGTWTRYEQLVRLRINPHLGGTKLTKVAPTHIEQLFASLEREGVSARGRQMTGTMLHMALKHAW